MMKKNNNILIVTGGTGGHVIPALNFFNYINNKSVNNFLLTDNRGYKYIKNINNCNILKIQSSHLSGNIYFKFKGIIKLIFGFFQSFIIFLKIRPKIIISFGSYASLAPLICFVLFKFLFNTKLYIHEQNSIIGQTNKFFSKYSNKIFVNFDKEYPESYENKSKIIVVGLPQKNNISVNKDKKNNNNFNFLVFGGSQGSIDILYTFIQIIKELKKINNLKKIKFIVQCPIHKQNEIKNILIQNNFEFEVKAFFNNFESILNKTNIALSRSGAGTVNDLINHKIPAIILPLPSAKNNHQFENAKILSDAECAFVVNQPSIEIDNIILFIRKVVDDKNFNKSLLDKFSKIKRYNTNELMWMNIKYD